MALLDAAPAAPDRLQLVPGAILPAIRGVAGDNRFLALTTINDDAVGPAMTVRRGLEEAPRCRRTAVLSEPELYRVADAVDGR